MGEVRGWPRPMSQYSITGPRPEVELAPTSLGSRDRPLATVRVGEV